MSKASIILVIIFLHFCFVSLGQPNHLKLLNYNALHGFNGDDVLKAKYINWVKEIAPDIVTYQEMNGYSQNDIGALAESYGHPYAVIMNQEFGLPVTHPIAITSKYPILNVKRVLDNMWHGYIYAYIHGLHLFVTHLAPFTLKDRQKDIDKILAQAKLLPQEGKILIAGDFNSLSPVDSLMYGNELLLSMKRIEGRKEPKSGTPILRYREIKRNNLNNGKIDYSVIERIIEEGYIDAFYQNNHKFKNSVPTKEYLKKGSKLRRIDYIWTNVELTKYITDVDIVQDEVTGFLSDHYPLMITFKIN